VGFGADLRTSLRAAQPDGRFVEDVPVRTLIARPARGVPPMG
jgi:hypothetical protein